MNTEEKQFLKNFFVAEFHYSQAKNAKNTSSMLMAIGRMEQLIEDARAKNIEMGTCLDRYNHYLENPYF
jgi:hypothetical protein